MADEDALRTRVTELQSAGVHLIARAEQAKAQLAIAREALELIISADDSCWSAKQKSESAIRIAHAALAQISPDP